MLRACKRLLRPGGRLAFATIFVPNGLPDDVRRRAVAAGPPAPTSPDLVQMVERAGFVDAVETDLTSDYLATTRAWLVARENHREVLRPLDPADFDDRVARGRAAIAAIEEGLLRRRLVVATRPLGRRASRP